jgi:hypothetical protein
MFVYPADHNSIASRRCRSHLFGSAREWIASEPLVDRNEIRQIRVFRG